MPKFKTTPLSPETLDADIKYFTRHIDIVGSFLGMVNDINKELKCKFLLPAMEDGVAAGRIFDRCITDYLNDSKLSKSKYSFRHGHDLKEVDCVCDKIPRLSFELKTTQWEKTNKDGSSSVPRIPFGSTNAGGGDKSNSNKYTEDTINEYKYCVFVQYSTPKTKGDKVRVLRIYLGIYKPTDIVTTVVSKNTGKLKNSKSASFSKKLFKKQFVLLYQDPSVKEKLVTTGIHKMKRADLISELKNSRKENERLKREIAALKGTDMSGNQKRKRGRPRKDEKNILYPNLRSCNNF